MHGAHNTCCNARPTLRKKCICARARAHMQRCRSFFAIEAIPNLSCHSESCASIVHTVVCHPFLKSTTAKLPIGFPINNIISLSNNCLFQKNTEGNPRRNLLRAHLQQSNQVFPHYGNSTEVGPAGQFVMSLDSSWSLGKHMPKHGCVNCKSRD